MAENRRGRLRRWGWILATVVAGTGAVMGAYWAAGDPEADVSDGARAVIVRGPLVVTVHEDADVQAEKRKVITNELRWPVIIDKVVPDGTMVEANQVIVKFSCKELDDAALQQEETVQTARSDHEQAQADLALKKEEVVEKLRKAEQAVVDARLDKTRYLQGEWPVKKAEQEEDIRLKKRELGILEKDLKFKKDTQKELGDKSPYTPSEIETDELKLSRNRLELAKSESKLTMLLEYDHPKDMRKFKTAETDADLALRRAKVDTTLELRKAEERVQHRHRHLERQEKEFKRLKEEQAKLTVIAKEQGLVVYDTKRHRWDFSNVVVAAGEKINPRQKIMIIPDMTTLQIRTKVFEAMSDMVHEGLKATIRLETDQQTPISGHVDKINPMPDEKSWHSSAVTFKVIVKLDKPVEGLRPNMTAKVELELLRLEDVVKAPVASVFYEQDKAYCWLISGGEQRKVEVKVGESNDEEVEIKSGLKPGDVVGLLEPEMPAKEPNGAPNGGGGPPPGMPG